jgi:hypothetical protein
MKRVGTGVDQAAVAGHMLHMSRMNQPPQQAVHENVTEIVCQVKLQKHTDAGPSCSTYVGE